MSINHHVVALLALSLLPTVAGAQPIPPDTCRQGYVWREAFPDDHVCVRPDVREQTAADNAQAASREASVGSFGPDTCRPGFVWRDAFPGDVVCVTPATREQAARDNAEGEARRQPDSGNLASSYVCRAPYVWRLARPRDFVCVTRETQAQTRADNQQAAARRGPDQCQPGFVWREANPRDYVCVSPQARAQAVADNREGPKRTVEACRQYASEAIGAYNIARSRGCRIGSDQVWNDNAQVHFNWCITVDPSTSEAVARVRFQTAQTCAPQSGGGGGGQPPNSPVNCCWIPAAGPNGAIYVTYQCGPGLRCP